MKQPEATEKPWGFEHLLHHGGFAMKMLHIEPDKRTSMHLHRQKEEAFYVVSGWCLVQIGDQMRRLGPGDVASIPVGVSHRISNHDLYRPVVLIEASTPQLDDVWRVKDDYGRESEETCA